MNKTKYKKKSLTKILKEDNLKFKNPNMLLQYGNALNNANNNQERERENEKKTIFVFR